MDTLELIQKFGIYWSLKIKKKEKVKYYGKHETKNNNIFFEYF
jgi:hypothetical protein